ncbi:hypothetical protein [Sulfurimonas sp. C5]|uniref:hypothetical protein n=1 Tax=Sulfurimonas sp. C5 TaxID=3036947 RepID=UPI00245390E6|nr:hypothetical protein [Sulfurimonas sp. C5]MDH4945106.1 hypothetical protein [Sulfurimonas sp. C5]
MYKTILLTLLLNCFLFASDVDLTQKLSYNTQIQLAHAIQKEAIVYGSGQQKVYVFIDPWCRYSRKFITMVSSNKEMLSKYRYYLYLYGIPRLHSQNAIAAVYNAKKPLSTLLNIMLHDDKTVMPLNTNIQNKINTIANTAKELHVNKRPFLIIEK